MHTLQYTHVIGYIQIDSIGKQGMVTTFHVLVSGMHITNQPRLALMCFIVYTKSNLMHVRIFDLMCRF